MNPVYLENVSLIGPGLIDWPQAQPILRREQPYWAEPLPVLVPSLLPANERRRITTTIKLALHLAQQALQDGLDAPPHAVFASSAGDSDITDRICRALALPERPVSPTHFHNSVHNAPAGYFAIATQSPAPSTSVAAGDGSFAAGLLEAATQLLAERQPVLLIAYDSQPPTPLMHKSAIREGLGVGMLLTPQPTGHSLCALRLNAVADAPESTCAEELEVLRLVNPAARCLPLLAAIAVGEGKVALPYVEGLQLAVEVMPC
jgi:hypothetical protein